MDMIKHSQSTQSNKFVISLQYLIKEVRDGFHFWHADKHQSFWKLTISFLIEVARHVQSTSVVMKNIQIFYRGLIMFFVTCSF